LPEELAEAETKPGRCRVRNRLTAGGNRTLTLGPAYVAVPELASSFSWRAAVPVPRRTSCLERPGLRIRPSARI